MKLKKEVLQPRAWEPDCVPYEDRSPLWMETASRVLAMLVVILVMQVAVGMLAVKLGLVDAEHQARIDALHRKLTQLDP